MGSGELEVEDVEFTEASLGARGGRIIDGEREKERRRGMDGRSWGRSWFDVNREEH